MSTLRQAILLLVGVGFFFSCTENTPLDKAQQIVDQAIAAHGGDRYENLQASYIFRDRLYTAQLNAGTYELSRQFMQGDSLILDVLTNDGFTRLINGKNIEVADTMATKYSNSINSVHYFALLPYRLNDEAVHKKYVGTTTIKNTLYEVVQVTFSEEKGGEDFEDVYYYWFHQDQHTLDYLAYNFIVDGGGVRFRQAYNSRVVNGIRFQDYVNFKTAKGTALETLPALFERQQLQELSTIELEKVTVE